MLSFDSHTVVKNLIAKGLKEDVAESIVNAIKASRDSDISKLVSREQFILMEKDVESLKNNVATKTDLVEVRNELKAEIALNRKDIETIKHEMATKTDLVEVRNELKTEIAEVRNELKAEIAEVRNEIALNRKDFEVALEKTKNHLTLMMGGCSVAVISILGFLQYFFK